VSAGRPDPPQNIATAIAEISERASLLVHEEIELAKAEVTEKITKLARGAIVGAVAGVFFLTALVMALFGGAWLLYYYLPGNDFTYFWGFFAMAVILVLLGVLAGLFAAKAVKKSSPPVPTMAIAEAQKIREAVSSPARAPTPPAPPAAPTAPPAASVPPSGNGAAADDGAAKPAAEESDS
jgi:MFS family permease